MLPDKLVYKANQIARFFAHRPDDEAALAIADHFKKFWDPRMRVAIIAYVDESEDPGLLPTALKAVAMITPDLAEKNT